MNYTMIETSLASNGYENSLKSTSNPRNVEYQAFAHVTKALSSLNPNALDYHTRKQEALFKNLRLWTIIGVEVADDKNELPRELRSKLFYLSEFTRNHTAKMHARTTNDASVLIDINKMVMRGLRSQQTSQGAAA